MKCHREAGELELHLCTALAGLASQTFVEEPPSLRDEKNELCCAGLSSWNAAPFSPLQQSISGTDS